MRLTHAVVLAALGNLFGTAGASVVVARADCKTYKIASGDSCSTIASASNKCGGIKLDDLYSYNSGLKDKCSTLKIGDYVCCNKGTMPDMDPVGYSNGTCKYYQVKSGDNCWGIANTRCSPAIDVAQLYKFNNMTEANCSTIAVKQALCCSKGTKPDFRPKKKADGSCVFHEVASGETCGTIAAANSLTVDELKSFNVGKTWGFNGCERLQPKQRICLSDGTPPFPAEAENKVDCGPRVQGTKAPTNGTKWADLNPCPLNVCCNTWGFCGTTPEFCVDTTIDKTPGSSKNGTNGCISNCGLDIVNNKNPPSNFAKIGYFESWNPYTRPCLNMDVTQINKGGEGYTHIHFAFANLTNDFQVSVSGVQDQWDKFVKLSDVKKVVAFGGWAFSNEPGTNHIIREGVKPANRAKFAASLVDFVKKYNIDGVDIDWEYPGATDIMGSQPGTAEDGPNYLAFLKLMRSSLGTGKSLSFAAPASFWYLKNFPIKEMAATVDYIVYMTYDLHGQWDVGNKWAIEACEGGNCLRSHVNKTETLYSLAMVTKAGVPANKVMVGVSSYGRSFKMAKADCSGPTCTFLGTREHSPALAGACTNTSGYIADAEIRQVKAIMDMGWSEANYVSKYDSDSDSDIFIYNNDEWVAWMDVETKKRRIDLYKSLGFAGTSDWAVDLQEEYGQMNDDDDDDDGSGNNGALDLTVKCDLTKSYSDLDALDRDAGDMWEPCLAMHSVTVLKGMLTKSFDGYDDASEGYDKLFPTYEKYIKDTMNTRLAHWLTDDKDGKKPGLTYYKCYYAQGAFYSKRENAKEVRCDKLPDKEPGQDYTFWWEREDEAGWKKSLSAAGIDPDWVEASEISEDDAQACPPQENASWCTITTLRQIGFPQRKDNIDIPNPKDVVVAAKANLTNLMDQYDDMYQDVGFDSFDGSLGDVVEVLAVPVFMFRDAIDLMGEVKELAKKVNKENTKNLILKIVEAVLMLIPFVGGALGAAGKTGAMLARFLMATEVAGSTGLGIYSIIEDPAMAPVAIFGMLMGALGTPSGSTYRKVAKVKSDMTPEMKSNMGKSFKDLNPKVESISAKMCKAK